jgi:alanine racemase
MKERSLEISLGAIRRNVLRIKKATGAKCLAVVKSDAYGMGALQVSRGLEGVADWLGTATLSEAVALRRGGIKSSLLVLGSTLPSDIPLAVSYAISLTAENMEFIAAAAKMRGSAVISLHLKVDTGMGRIGVKPLEISQAVELISFAPCLSLEGIFSHFATAEAKEATFVLKQISLMKSILSGMKKQPALTHIANSAAILRYPDAARLCSMVRPGVLLYGVMPDIDIKDTIGVEYALKGTSSLLHINEMKKGTSFGYGLAYTCRKKSRVGILDLGYGYGYNRALSNHFFVKRNRTLYPVRGRICMNQTFIEVEKESSVGESYTFLDRELKVEKMAQICNTVPHEILCNMGGERMKKVYNE